MIHRGFNICTLIVVIHAHLRKESDKSDQMHAVKINLPASHPHSTNRPNFSEFVGKVQESHSPPVFRPHVADEPMDAYVISPPELYGRATEMLDKLKQAVHFNPQRIAPVKVKADGTVLSEDKTNRTDLDTSTGCFRAHQSVWSKIAQSGKVALVLESDAIIEPDLDEAILLRLRHAATLARESQKPIFVGLGHCGIYCMHAYLLGPEAAKLAEKIEDGQSKHSLPDSAFYGALCCSANSTDALNGTSTVMGNGMYGPRCVSHGPVECKWVYKSLFMQNRTITGVRDPQDKEHDNQVPIETWDKKAVKVNDSGASTGKDAA